VLIEFQLGTYSLRMHGNGYLGASRQKSDRNSDRKTPIIIDMNGVYK